MTLLQLAVFLAAALLGAVLRMRRGPFLLVASALAAFWLQPALPIRQLDFWLPLAGLGLAVVTWAATQQGRVTRGDAAAAALLAGVVLLLALSQTILPNLGLTASNPPSLWNLVLAILLILLMAAGAVTLQRRLPQAARFIPPALILILLGLFLIIKEDTLLVWAAGRLRLQTHQDPALASLLDIRWLGFSYLAFRLIHALRDRMTGRLPDCSLEEFIVYAVFFPAYSSGPIDRIERFAADLRRPFQPTAEALLDGGRRIVWGIFKKFALADTLALVALSGASSGQVTAAGWMWVILYAYAFRIFFDFSGYTDIAIGLGRWMGFSLPENFDRPYSKTDLTAFWNAWHITLAQWFRAYWFNPLTRALRSRWRSLPVPMIIAAGQLTTMALIGLWHGITWNFFAWGLWHGVGLAVHNRWAEHRRAHAPAVEPPAWRRRLGALAGWALTFHYVALGWVWFALPTMDSSLAAFARLFGLAAGGA